jgi:hypothetical protein
MDDIPEELTSRCRLPYLDVSVNKPKAEGNLIVFSYYRSKSAQQVRSPVPFMMDYKLMRMKESKQTQKVSLQYYPGD